MEKVKIKETINQYLNKLSDSQLEEIANYIKNIYEFEKERSQPKKQPSELGKKLRAIRAKIISEGEPLLTAEELER